MDDEYAEILITGANGFSARYLASLLLNRKGVHLAYADLKVKNKKDWHKCDLADFKQTFQLLKKIGPGQIYHLAGAYSNDYDTDYKANVLTTKNILDSILKAKLKCRVLLIGSAAEYGNVSERDNPVAEDHPLNPVSVYGLTKVYQTYLMKFYFLIFDMDIVMARVFNLFGRDMPEALFVGRLYKQIEDYKKRHISKITVGNLDNKRDYIDVAEAVKYYETIMNYGIAGEIYNVGTGKSARSYDILQSALKENGLPMDIVDKFNTGKHARADVADIYADLKKISLLKNNIHNLYDRTAKINIGDHPGL